MYHQLKRFIGGSRPLLIGFYRNPWCIYSEFYNVEQDHTNTGKLYVCKWLYLPQLRLYRLLQVSLDMTDKSHAFTHNNRHVKKMANKHFCLVLGFYLFWSQQAFEREVDAHRAVSHPSVLDLHDVDVVSKGTYKEARMLVTYYKVFSFHLLHLFKCQFY